MSVVENLNQERRITFCLYEYWEKLAGENSLPALKDMNREEIAPFKKNLVLLDLRNGQDRPTFQVIGQELQEDLEADLSNMPVSSVPRRTMLSRITDHYQEVLANRVPIAFEAEFVNRDGEKALYRGILLPFSDDNKNINFILGGVRWILEKDVTLDDGKPTIEELMKNIAAGREDKTGVSLEEQPDPETAAEDPLEEEIVAEEVGFNEDNIDAELVFEDEGEDDDVQVQEDVPDDVRSDEEQIQEDGKHDVDPSVERPDEVDISKATIEELLQSAEQDDEIGDEYPVLTNEDTFPETGNVARDPEEAPEAENFEVEEENIQEVEMDMAEVEITESTDAIEDTQQDISANEVTSDFAEVLAEEDENQNEFNIAEANSKEDISGNSADDEADAPVTEEPAIEGTAEGATPLSVDEDNNPKLKHKIFIPDPSAYPEKGTKQSLEEVSELETAEDELILDEIAPIDPVDEEVETEKDLSSSETSSTEDDISLEEASEEEVEEDVEMVLVDQLTQDEIVEADISDPIEDVLQPDEAIEASSDVEEGTPSFGDIVEQELTRENYPEAESKNEDLSVGVDDTGTTPEDSLELAEEIAEENADALLANELLEENKIPEPEQSISEDDKEDVSDAIDEGDIVFEDETSEDLIIEVSEEPEMVVTPGPQEAGDDVNLELSPEPEDYETDVATEDAPDEYVDEHLEETDETSTEDNIRSRVKDDDDDLSIEELMQSIISERKFDLAYQREQQAKEKLAEKNEKQDLDIAETGNEEIESPEDSVSDDLIDAEPATEDLADEVSDGLENEEPEELAATHADTHGVETDDVEEPVEEFHELSEPFKSEDENIELAEDLSIDETHSDSEPSNYVEELDAAPTEFASDEEDYSETSREMEREEHEGDGEKETAVSFESVEVDDDVHNIDVEVSEDVDLDVFMERELAETNEDLTFEDETPVQQPDEPAAAHPEEVKEDSDDEVPEGAEFETPNYQDSADRVEQTEESDIAEDLPTEISGDVIISKDDTIEDKDVEAGSPDKQIGNTPETSEPSPADAKVVMNPLAEREKTKKRGSVIERAMALMAPGFGRKQVIEDDAPIAGNIDDIGIGLSSAEPELGNTGAPLTEETHHNEGFIVGSAENEERDIEKPEASLDETEVLEPEKKGEPNTREDKAKEISSDVEAVEDEESTQELEITDDDIFMETENITSFEDDIVNELVGPEQKTSPETDETQDHQEEDARPSDANETATATEVEEAPVADAEESEAITEPDTTDYEQSLKELQETHKQIVGYIKKEDANHNRSRDSLYNILTAIYEFHETCERSPEAYHALVEEADLKIQSRAPFTPMLKICLGKDYDKTRLTEYSAALGIARYMDVAVSEFHDFIKNFPGGIKGCVKEMRVIRKHGASGNVMARKTKSVEEAREILREMAPIVSFRLKKVIVGNNIDEFCLLLAKRDGHDINVLKILDEKYTKIDPILKRAAFIKGNLNGRK